MEKALTIYKASAGSGKTFTLASEYITLVVKNPQDYSRILAVTFTNKATQEMKMRILTQLYGIAHSLKESQPYFEQVQTKTDLPEITIRENAAEALSLLTHHYNYFRVLTIDAFFQAILRNLARELNLTANLRIDLNDTQVEAQAVDNLVNDLEEGKDVLIWISDYIDRNIEDNQGWNVIDQIKDFGKNIIPMLLEEDRRIYAFPFAGYWKDVGTIESLWEANMDLIKRREEFNISDKSWKIYYRHEGRLPQYIGESAEVTDSMISDGTIVLGKVHESIVSSGVSIAKNSKVLGSIIMQNAVIEEGATVVNSIIAEGTVVKSGVTVGHEEIELGKDMITVIGNFEVVEEDTKVGGN